MRTELVKLIVFKITPRCRPHRKRRSFIANRVFVSAGTCLPSRCLKPGSNTPLFYCCVHVCLRWLPSCLQTQCLATGLHAIYILPYLDRKWVSEQRTVKPEHMTVASVCGEDGTGFKKDFISNTHHVPWGGGGGCCGVNMRLNGCPLDTKGDVPKWGRCSILEDIATL
jgi:hypothetical protein